MRGTANKLETAEIHFYMYESIQFSKRSNAGGVVGMTTRYGCDISFCKACKETDTNCKTKAAVSLTSVETVSFLIKKVNPSDGQGSPETGYNRPRHPQGVHQ